jgi:hypothetical protein
MSKKNVIKEESMSIGVIETIEGYAIYDKGVGQYYDQDYDWGEDIFNAKIYENIETVKSDIEEMDDFDSLLIHKIKIICEIEEIQQASIVWNVIAGKVEKE